MLVTTSPGLTALLEGMFSQLGINPTTLTLGLNTDSALKTPNTLAAPHMSNFISSISLAGLMEIPPVSKVMPLPTKTVGATAFAAPKYLSTIKRSGSAEPCATAMKDPIFSLVTSLSPSTSQVTGDLPAAICWAASASMLGVA